MRRPGRILTPAMPRIIYSLYFDLEPLDDSGQTSALVAPLDRDGQSRYVRPPCVPSGAPSTCEPATG